MATTATIGGNGTLFVGEDKLLRLELLDASGVPVDMTGWTILFDVRLKDTSADPAILSKTPTISGVYTGIRSTNAQRAEVTLSDDDMNLFKAKTYRYSWKRMDANNEVVLARGDFAPEKATAP
jgi:hypothetical protein